MSITSLLLAASAGILVFPAAPAATLTRSTSSNISYDWTRNPFPHWRGGAMLTVEASQSTAPVVRAFGGDGVQIGVLPILIPGAKLVAVQDAARGSSGQIVAVGAAVDSEGRSGGFVAISVPPGAPAKIVATSPYMPHLVTVASDGTFWTAGTNVGPKSSMADIFWRFDMNGKKIGSTVPQTAVVTRAHLVDAQNELDSRAGRVGWLCPVEGRYIEFSNDGTILSTTGVQIPPGETVDGFGIADNNLAFLRTQSKSGGSVRFGIYQMDIRSGSLANVSSAEPFILLGTQGNYLVGLSGTNLLNFAIQP